MMQSLAVCGWGPVMLLTSWPGASWCGCGCLWETSLSWKTHSLSFLPDREYGRTCGLDPWVLNCGSLGKLHPLLALQLCSSCSPLCFQWAVDGYHGRKHPNRQTPVGYFLWAGVDSSKFLGSPAQEEEAAQCCCLEGQTRTPRLGDWQTLHRSYYPVLLPPVCSFQAPKHRPPSPNPRESSKEERSLVLLGLPYLPEAMVLSNRQTTSPVAMFLPFQVS